MNRLNILLAFLVLASLACSVEFNDVALHVQETVAVAQTQTTRAKPSDTATATVTPSATSTITPTPTVTFDPFLGFPLANAPKNVAVYDGPGYNYLFITVLKANDSAIIVGKSEDGQWWFVKLLDSGIREGWILASDVNVSGNTTLIPKVTPPSTYTPSPIPTSTRTPTPAFTATPSVIIVGTSRGVRGDYFRVRTGSVGINEDIWFDFKVTNTTDQTIPFSGLGAVALNKQGQPSFGKPDVLTPNQIIEWSDHINISTAGTYTLYLGICWLDTRTACEQNGTVGSWDLLSSGYTVVVK